MKEELSNQGLVIGLAGTALGIGALIYADWKLISTGTVLTLLFGLSCLLGFVMGRVGFVFSGILSFAVVVSRWWMWVYVAGEPDWHLGVLCAAVIAVACSGVVVGMCARRILP